MRYISAKKAASATNATSRMSHGAGSALHPLMLSYEPSANHGRNRLRMNRTFAPAAI